MFQQQRPLGKLTHDMRSTTTHIISALSCKVWSPSTKMNAWSTKRTEQRMLPFKMFCTAYDIRTLLQHKCTEIGTRHFKEFDIFKSSLGRNARTNF